MGKFLVQLYEKNNNEVPVKEFIEAQSLDMQMKILHNMELLADYGNMLPMPYSKPLKDGIFELRTKALNGITRILYFFYVDRKIVLTNGFVKKTQKTPPSEIEKAKKYKKDFIQRQNIGK